MPKHRRNRNKKNNIGNPEQNTAPVIDVPSEDGALPLVNVKPQVEEVVELEVDKVVKPQVDEIVELEVDEAAEPEVEEDSENNASTADNLRARLYNWGSSLANRIGATGKAAWNTSKNTVNAGMTFAGSYIPAPVASRIETAWNTSKNAVNSGMKFAASYPVASRIGTAWNTGKNAVNAGMKFAGSYIPSPVASRIETAWNTGKNAVNSGMKFAGSYLPSRATVVDYVKSSLYKISENIIGKIWTTGDEATLQQNEKGDPVDSQIQEMVNNNREKVGSSVADSSSLLRIFLLMASKKTQNAVINLHQNKEIMALLRGNEQLLGLLGTATLEEGISLLTAEQTDGGELPINEIAALQIILQTLNETALNESGSVVSEDVVLVHQFLSSVVPALKDLQEGKKQYISLVTEANGKVQVMHISASDLLSSPEVINQILSVLIKQGATQNFNIRLTSVEEAAALSAALRKNDLNSLIYAANTLSQEYSRALVLSGVSSAIPITNLAGLISFITSEAANPRLIALLLGVSDADWVHARDRVAEELSKRPGFARPEIFDLMSTMATLLFASQDISRAVKDNVGAIGAFARRDDVVELENNIVTVLDRSLQDESALQAFLLGNIPSTPQLTNGAEQQTATITLEEHPPVVVDNTIDDSEPADSNVIVEEGNALDLTKQRQKYKALLEKLASKVQEFYDEGDYDASYQKVAGFALALHDQLQIAAQAFFAAPTKESLEAFKESCRTSVKEAEAAFGEHRSLWYQLNPVIRGIFGVLAVLTIIPALVVAGSSNHGYYDTFFGKPVTNSAKELADMTLELDDTHNEVNQAISAAPAA